LHDVNLDVHGFNKVQHYVTLPKGHRFGTVWGSVCCDRHLHRHASAGESLVHRVWDASLRSAWHFEGLSSDFVKTLHFQVGIRKTDLSNQIGNKTNREVREANPLFL